MTAPAAGEAAMRLLAVALLCATLAAAMPSQMKGSEGAAATAGDECVSGHRKVNEEAGCGGNCYCLGGHWVCPESECGTEVGSNTQKLISENLEQFPLRRNKRAPSSSSASLAETSDVTAIVIAERCVPHTRFRVDCNACLCPTSGIKARASCTVGPCPSTRAPPPPTPTPTPRPCPASAAASVPAARRCPGDSNAVDPLDLEAADDPSVAVAANLVLGSLPAADTTPMPPCTFEEKIANATHCVAVPLDGERCAPGVTYMDECNTCICSMDGIKAHASCTFKTCPK